MPDLKAWIRDVPDFPKPGILFRDFTPMMRDPRGWQLMVRQLGEVCERLQPEVIVGIESRGFLVGTALAHLLQEVRYGQVMAAVRQTPGPWLLWSLLATAISYVTLTQYDASALRYIGARVPRGTVALTAFVAYALSNTIGLGPLSGGAVRMRLYTQAGLEPGQIARVIGFNTVAFMLGMLAFGALGLLWGAPTIAPLLHLSAGSLQGLAVAMLLSLAAFVALCHHRRVLA